MTTFSYTTGNPANLTGGASASMNDIQGPFTDLRTFVNGGNIDYTNLASTVQVDYKMLERGGGQLGSGAAATVYLFGPTFPTAMTVGTAGSVVCAFRLDPADFPAGARSVKYRVRAQLVVNATASATTHTVGLYPISAFGGGSGAIPNINTLGAVVAGSTVALSSAVASSSPEGNSGDFSAPAAGYYCLAVNSGGTSANSLITLLAELQVRQV